MSIVTRILETPLGRYQIGASAEGLCRLAPALDDAADVSAGAGDRRARGHLAAAGDALHAYFAGTRRDFGDLVLAPRGSAFMLRVCEALREIPFGETESYGALARRIGHPGAARAVGLANARNPLALVIPCHRVIGSDGELTGYAGGLWRKRWLLVHEGALSLICLPPAPASRPAVATGIPGAA
jgi:methylated-DNA-[protein]-cysteine S-methyltransferase